MGLVGGRFYRCSSAGPGGGLGKQQSTERSQAKPGDTCQARTHWGGLQRATRRLESPELPVPLGRIFETGEGSSPWSLFQPGRFTHCSLISEKVELCATLGCLGQRPPPPHPS